MKAQTSAIAGVSSAGSELELPYRTLDVHVPCGRLGA